MYIQILTNYYMIRTGRRSIWLRMAKPVATPALVPGSFWGLFLGVNSAPKNPHPSIVRSPLFFVEAVATWTAIFGAQPQEKESKKKG
ncbi:hypothetical protein FN846DRAFT_947875, partial [Sphaerosporella brunnea]